MSSLDGPSDFQSRHILMIITMCSTDVGEELYFDYGRSYSSTTKTSKDLLDYVYSCLVQMRV